MRKKAKKIEWKMIRIPKEVHEIISDYAKRLKIARWKIIYDSFQYWNNARLSHFRANANVIDKTAWYIYKLCSSVGSFRERPTKENYGFLMKTIEQVTQRLDVDTSRLKLSANQYLKKPNKKNRIVLNDSAKSVVINILEKINEV